MAKECKIQIEDATNKTYESNRSRQNEAEWKHNKEKIVKNNQKNILKKKLREYRKRNERKNEEKQLMNLHKFLPSC